MNFIVSLWSQFESTLPLFLLVFIGYGLIKIGKWPKAATDSLTRFVFSVAMPIMLFGIMSRFSEQERVDYRLLLAFFGGCFIVFIIGRIIASKLFKLDDIASSVFAMGGIFSNNVLVGLPIAIALLGEEAIPSVALVLVFNTLILWTLITISVEWAKMEKLSFSGLKYTLISVAKNPIIIGIFSGLAYNFTGLKLPLFIAKPTEMISLMAAPLSLIVLGMGLAEYRLRDGWRLSGCICFLKLVIHPLVIWLLALVLGLPILETNVVVLLGSISLGINVYLMARKFNTLQAAVGSSLLISTLLSAVTTPLILAVIAHI